MSYILGLLAALLAGIATGILIGDWFHPPFKPISEDRQTPDPTPEPAKEPVKPTRINDLYKSSPPPFTPPPHLLQFRAMLSKHAVVNTDLQSSKPPVANQCYADNMLPMELPDITTPPNCEDCPNYPKTGQSAVRTCWECLGQYSAVNEEPSELTEEPAPKLPQSRNRGRFCKADSCPMCNMYSKAGFIVSSGLIMGCWNCNADNCKKLKVPKTLRLKPTAKTTKEVHV